MIANAFPPAKSILALSDEQIRQLIENGQFEEVNKDG
jgi:hypothetical protein